MAIDGRLLDCLDSWDRDGQPIPADALRAALGGLRLDRGDVADSVAFGDDAYRRNVLRRSPGYEALLLCWHCGQCSPIHDHRGSTCAVLVVEGVATETRYEADPGGRLTPGRACRMGAGTLTVSSDADIHRFGNPGPGDSDLITLHVYSPPLSAMRTYPAGATIHEAGCPAVPRPHVLERRKAARP